jgi:hypothetical protein
MARGSYTVGAAVPNPERGSPVNEGADGDGEADSSTPLIRGGTIAGTYCARTHTYADTWAFWLEYLGIRAPDQALPRNTLFCAASRDRPEHTPLLHSLPRN